MESRFSKYFPPSLPKDQELFDTSKSLARNVIARDILSMEIREPVRRIAEINKWNRNF